MKIEWILACQGVAETEQGTHILGAGVDTTFAPPDDPPWELQIHLAIRLVGSYDDGKEDSDHTLTLRVLDPDMAEIHVDTQRIRIFARGPEHYEGWRGTGIFGTVTQCQIERTGTYTVTVSLDRDRAETVPYEVRPAGDLVE